MKLDYLPLLATQRGLYAIPRGWERFDAYLRTLIDPETRDLGLPMGAMNPMGKNHVPALLDEYLALDADGLAADAVSEAAAKLADVAGEFKVTLVISDDAMGQWTNRYATEFSHRFESKPYHRRGWLTGMLWTSEQPSAQGVRLEAMTAVFRAAHISRHGFPRTLRGMLAQEGYAMAMAGRVEPGLDAEEISHAREVIGPHLDTKDHPTIMAALFGVEAADSLGYPRLRLGSRAGLALALIDGQMMREPSTP